MTIAKVNHYIIPLFKVHLTAGPCMTSFTFFIKTAYILSDKKVNPRCEFQLSFKSNIK